MESMRLSGNTDCHTSDVGHWFAMTETNFACRLTAAREMRTAVIFWVCYRTISSLFGALVMTSAPVERMIITSSMRTPNLPGR